MIGSSPVDLIKCVAAEVDGIITGYRLETGRQGDDVVKPVIFEQVWPSPSSEKQNIPFILVTMDKYIDMPAESQARISICICTSADNDDGWMDAMNQAQRIRLELLKKNIVGGKYILLRPLEIDPTNQLDFDQRTYPLHYVTINTIWQVPAVMQEYGQEGTGGNYTEERILEFT